MSSAAPNTGDAKTGNTSPIQANQTSQKQPQNATSAAATSETTSSDGSEPEDRKIWIVMDHAHDLTDVHDRRYTHFAGAFTTYAGALTRLRRRVRMFPPAGQDVETFLADDRNWVQVMDDYYLARGMGYQYTTRDACHQAMWVEEVPLRSGGVDEFVGPLLEGEDGW